MPNYTPCPSPKDLNIDIRVILCKTSKPLLAESKFMPKAAIPQAVYHVPLVIDRLSGARVLETAPTCLLINNETASFLRTVNHFHRYGYIGTDSASGGQLFPTARDTARDCLRMRLAAYAGASTALAAGVIVYAFNQRANFYSACVYLSQSNLCLMILTNLILFIIASLMFGLQRIFYGPLRPIEIEQLYEKAWFAVTETCLAMTIFREEVGAWFLVMFVALLAGKVWGWIGEGRVEVLEQQPPENPRLVHTRLSLSLALSLAYDTYILGYTINTVIQQARPNMMVMFLFEFAILTTSSLSTALRYCISLIEARIVKQQMVERLEWRRREVREEREEILRQRAVAAAAAETAEGSEPAPELPALPSEDDVDEMDIDVPGWEAKGQWVLSLDLMTDFVKLGIYSTFFFILLTFYGLPIHIMRDLFLTARSFIKRLTAFLRYRKATQDMNERYPDATVEEIQREDTCIICREEMRPWSVTNPAEPPAEDPAAPANRMPPANGAGQPLQAQARPRPTPTLNERTRPKKLPCGHVLHLGCLKSWLERQQVCPTCRRPVVDNRQPHGHPQQPGQGVQGQVAGRAQPAGAGAGGQANEQAPQANNNLRMIQLGPLRFAFGQANNMQDFAQRFPGGQQNQHNPAPAGPRLYGLELGFPRHQPPPPQGTAAAANRPASTIQAQLQHIEQQIMHDIVQLRLNQEELAVIQRLQAQLTHHRSTRGANATTPATGGPPQIQQAAPGAIFYPFSGAPPIALTGLQQHAVPRLQQHAAVPGASVIPSGSPDLPPGLTLPEGWSLLPLQRLDLAAPEINGALSQLSGSQPTASTGIRVLEPAAATTQSVPTSSAAANDSSEVSSSMPIAPTTNGTEQSAPILTEIPTSVDGHTSIMDGIEPPLPNWGAAQQFGSSNPGNPVGTSPATTAQPSDPATGQTANGSASHLENEETMNGMAKGKAKSATVEDSKDDS